MDEAECDCEITDCECPKFEGIASGDLEELARSRGVTHTRYGKYLKELVDYLDFRKVGASRRYFLKPGVANKDGKWLKLEVKFSGIRFGSGSRDNQLFGKNRPSECHPPHFLPVGG
jgi:hypothetical protein